MFHPPVPLVEAALASELVFSGGRSERTNGALLGYTWRLRLRLDEAPSGGLGLPHFLRLRPEPSAEPTAKGERPSRRAFRNKPRMRPLLDRSPLPFGGAKPGVTEGRKAKKDQDLV